MENFATRKTNSLADLINPAIKQMNTNNATSRKAQKPQYSRFKASIKYCDNQFPKAMFSYDWNKIYGTDGKPIGKDHEEIGFGKLCKWILKCIKDGTIEKVRIFATLSKNKSTDVMDYDTCVLEWNSLMSEGMFQPIRELAFDINGKCILSKLESKGGKNEQI